MLLSIFKVGEDGKTAYQRQTGKRCITEVVPFADIVWYRELQASGDRKRSLATKWKTGVWLGHARNSAEVLVGTPDGVVRAWAVRRRPAEERWNCDIIKRMPATPRDPSRLQGLEKSEDDHQLVREEEEDAEEELKKEARKK